jgi:hypothetical protein
LNLPDKQDFIKSPVQFLAVESAHHHAFAIADVAFGVNAKFRVKLGASQPDQLLFIIEYFQIREKFCCACTAISGDSSW